MPRDSSGQQMALTDEFLKPRADPLTSSLKIASCEQDPDATSLAAWVLVV